MKEKLVLAYSGGLDTSVAISYLKEAGWDVIALCLDVGEGKDLKFIKEKALKIGAVESIVLDVREEFANEYVGFALQSNALYEGKYPLVSALSRPLIAKKLVEIAHAFGATAVAHGCTGKGNDQVRFEVAIQALNPTLKVVAPVRDWSWSREEEIEYAAKRNIPIPVDLDSPYSIDQNLWGRSNECGVLEDPWAAPPEGAYGITSAVENTPDTPDVIEITFEKGLPTALNNVELPFYELIEQLNKYAGIHGVGRIDHVENRLVGIKSREVYECPAAVTLIRAHQELEHITLSRDVAHFKPIIELKISELIYNALWYSPLKSSLESFVLESQQHVTGTVRVKLFKGQAVVEGRTSPYSLYDEKLATYTKEDTFNHKAAEGFIEIYGLSTKVFHLAHKKEVKVKL